MPSVSVIVPARNAENHLGRCLAALFAGDWTDMEVVVVDDGSTDGTAKVAGGYPCRYVPNGAHRGTSASRNHGASLSTGEVLIFVDSDVVVRPDTIGRVAARFAREPDLVGVNGLLDASHPFDSVVSQFVNLSIHYQHLRFPALTHAAFTSIFAIRRSVFEAIGGFAEEYRMPFADDVSVRFKLADRPPCILQDFDLCVEHLNRFNLRKLCVNRFLIGYYYVFSVLSHLKQVGRNPGSAYLHPRYPLNVALFLLLVVTGALGAISRTPTLLWALAIAAAGLLVNNLGLFRLIRRHRGIRDALVAPALVVVEAAMYVVGLAAGLFAWTFDRHRRISP